MAAGGDTPTIKARFGVDTKEGKDDLDDLKRHGEGFGKSFSDLFKQEPAGTRRMRGTFASLIRDMSGAQGSAQGLAGGISTLFERISIGGGIAGAALVGLAIGFQRLVARGAELKKTMGDIEKESRSTQRESRLATEAQGYDTLAAKANEFRHRERRARDEARKDEEHHFGRETSRRALILAEHPGWLFHPERIDAKVAEEAVKNRQAQAKEAAAIAREDELSYKALQLGADEQRVLLQGSQEEVTMSKLSSEYQLRRAALEARRHPDQQKYVDELNKEFAYRTRIAQLQDAQLKTSLSGQERLVDIQNSALSAEEKSLATAQARLDIARQQEAIAANRGPEEQQKARTAVKEAAGGVAEAATSQLEREGAEEEMTEQEKWKQYWQRIKKMEGLRHAAARRGIDSQIITPPKYGEAEYDPTSEYRAAIAQAAAGGRPPAAQQPQAQQPQLPPNASTESTLVKIHQALTAAGKPGKPAAPAEPGAPAPAAPTAAPAGAGSAGTTTTTGAGTTSSPTVTSATTAPPAGAPGGAQFPAVGQPGGPPVNYGGQSGYGAASQFPLPSAGAGEAQPEAAPAAEEAEAANRRQSMGAEVIKNIPPELIGVTGAGAAGLMAFAELAHPQELGAASLSPKQQKESFERGIAAAEAKGDKAGAERLRQDPDYAKAQRLEQQEQQEQAFRKSHKAPAQAPPQAIDQGYKPQNAAERAVAEEATAATATAGGYFTPAAPSESKRSAVSQFFAPPGSGIAKMFGLDKDEQAAKQAAKAAAQQQPQQQQPQQQQPQQAEAAPADRGQGPLVGVAPYYPSTPAPRGKGGRVVGIPGGQTLREQIKSQDIASQASMPGESVGDYQNRMEALRQNLPSTSNATNVNEGRPIDQATLSRLGITPESYANTDWSKVKEIQNNADAYNKMWSSPQTQEGMAGQAEIGRAAAADEHTGTVGSWKGKSTLPDFGLPTPGAPSPFNPITTPVDTGMSGLGPQTNAGAQGGGGQGQGQDNAVLNKIAAATEKMVTIWQT